ncbi:glycosyltransferase [Flavobacterium sp.]|jgi:hypothetical protein|uniref:glycosyltransferase n=1 Tax=Flavobacterium sp. TaxID=239 RepID=UPI0037C02989
MFNHYLITRFNLKNPNWGLTKNNEAILDEKWMEERMVLFENYCLSSVTNQSNTNFKWLLFFDTTTSDFYKNKIAELLQPYSFIVPIYINGMALFHKSLNAHIEQNSQGVPYLITSMIDNDDCLHKNYIQEVQNQFAKQDFLAIDFINGYTLQIEPDMILGKKDHIFNPFISLIEKNDNPKTVWFYDHHIWKKEPRIKSIYGKRMWMSVIHGKNKVNEFDGYGNVDLTEVFKDFIVSDQILKKISTSIIPFSKWKGKSFKNYCYVKMVWFSKVFKKSIGVYRFK